ncbi:MAG: hypothetical protein IJM91_07900 [Lachnospiraceae bacterium]|nr:hypothetical protein [Lachnospiraceae bacterium]
MKATLTGGHAEFLSSGRLDDLQCVYSGVKAICLPCIQRMRPAARGILFIL